MTSAIFPNRLDGYFEDDNRRFTLDTDFIYADTEKDIRVVVPAGFTTDWNSIPRPLWAWFAPWEYPEAGLVHDWLYTNPSGFGSATIASPLTKDQCDNIHRRILDLKGCRWTKRQLVYAALRVGGGVAWNRHRAEQASQPKGATGYTYLEAVSNSLKNLQNTPTIVEDEVCKKSDDAPEPPRPTP